jgi:hypothetical protein
MRKPPSVVGLAWNLRRLAHRASPGAPGARTLVEFKEGKITRMRDYLHPNEAIEAAGRRE